MTDSVCFDSDPSSFVARLLAEPSTLDGIICQRRFRMSNGVRAGRIETDPYGRVSSFWPDYPVEWSIYGGRLYVTPTDPAQDGISVAIMGTHSPTATMIMDRFPSAYRVPLKLPT